MINRRIFIVILATTLFYLQLHAQNEQQLTLNSPIEGTIENPGDSQSWRFNALRGDALSFHVVGQGDFDPILTIRTANGAEIIANDDFNFPVSSDALLEAITIPQTGDYDAIVTGFDQSTGEFTLVMLPGYSDLALDERFTSDDGWTIEEPAAAQISDGQLTLELTGIQQIGTGTEATLEPLADFHAETTVTAIQHRSGWGVGLLLRQQENGDHYRITVNSRGTWRFTAIENGAERIIRDWSPHPAIVEGETRFTLGVIAHGSGFEFFYNRQLIGSLADRAIREPGRISLQVVTSNALDSMVRVTFDDVVVTVPAESSGEPVFPRRLVRGNASLTVSELERRQVIPSAGQLALVVEESTFEGRSPGVFPLVLARGTTFENFAIGTTVSLQSPVIGGIGACGLLVRNGGETNYMVAFLDTAGGFGVSQRQDDAFVPGLYAENTAWDITQPNDLLLVLNNNALHYFVNGFHVGSMEIEPTAGEVGNVVVNFDPVLTQCRFDDTWVWRWE